MKRKIHFIGIGGIGVSALAQYYLALEWKVSGSDLKESETTDFLKKKGARIFSGRHKKENVSKGTDLAVYSPAVRKDNPELKKAREMKIKCQSYPEALGEISAERFTIAVSGTHGKSTTTAMAALVLKEAGFDPLVMIGTKMKEFSNTNFRMGKGPFLIEADEHFGSFLNYSPNIIILTNIEKDHLDYYKNIGNLIKSFKKYVGLLPQNGVLIANKDDKNVRKINFKNTLWYSLKSGKKKILEKTLQIPGFHNVSNALAVMALAKELGIKERTALKALGKFKGTWRRFEITKAFLKGKKKIIVVSDYAHHPTEIAATMKACREKWPAKRIWLLFQPHQLQRTFYLFKEFVSALRSAPADQVIVTDIFSVPGREEKSLEKKVSSKKLAENAKKESIRYIAKKNLEYFLKNNLESEDVLVVMGAGDIYKIALEIKKW